MKMATASAYCARVLLLFFFAECECVSLPAQTWNLAWSDEFDGTSIDPAKWAFEHGDLRVNKEIEYYCGPEGDSHNDSPCNSQNPNVYVDGLGHLVIQAFEISSNTVPYSDSWTSARMKTANLASFSYGRIESSMKLPSGARLWPAFWALGTNLGTVGWPNCGELDFMENVPASVGLGPAVIRSTLHGPTYGPKSLGQNYTLPNGGRVDTAYHAYGVIWSPFMVQFYVDDPKNVFFVKTADEVPGGAAQWAFNHPFYLIMNLAVGGRGSWPGPPDRSTPSPAVMMVDYVRQYAATPVAAPDLGHPAAVTVKAGATTGNTSMMNITSANDIGRTYLSCSTNAPQASCTVASSDPLDEHTVDFSKSLTPTATVTVTTIANAAREGMRAGGGTFAGKYTITVGAYTVSNTGGAADATVSIPLTVH